MKRTIYFFYRPAILLFFYFAFLLTLNSEIFAQQFTPPPGEAIHDKSIGSHNGYPRRFITTRKNVYISNFDGNQWTTPTPATGLPEGKEIVDSHLKGGSFHSYLVLLDDGSVYQIQLGSTIAFPLGKVDPGSSLPKQIDGDAIYVLTNNSIFVNRGTSTNWDLDVTGLGNDSPQYVVIDTLMYACLATSNGLYKQHPDSSIWRKINSFPNKYMTSVYVDKSNRIFASTYSDVYVSTDGAKTWNTNNTGLAQKGVTRFGEDNKKNIYAIAGNMVYRSDGGTSAWTRIDKPVSDLISDLSTYALPFNDVGGDSALFLATNYGLFKSTDQGTTWMEYNQGISSSVLYGFTKITTRKFMTTNLGLFYQNQNNGTWTKSFPAKGYITGSVIYSDKSGNVYTLGARKNPSDYASIPSNWKSTDNGSTWFADTAGLGAIGKGQAATYFVDENGTQHFSFYDSQTAPAKIFLKTAGNSWVRDTSGYGKRTGDQPIIFGSDKHGFLYAAFITNAYGGILFKKPITSGAWTLDTLGLQRQQIYSISSDAAGNPYVGTSSNGVYRKSGNTWTHIPPPSGLQSNSAFVTAIDKGGALFAGFSNFVGNKAVWHGVHFTTDNGATWKYVGLDNIPVRYLYADGDTVFAITYYNGAYKLTRNSATTVEKIDNLIPSSFELFQNYPNPFNPATTISFSVPSLEDYSGKSAHHVVLKVFDLLGKEVATLVDEEKQAGNYKVTFDAGKLASGVYFYRLQSDDFVLTKKLMLLK